MPGFSCPVARGTLLGQGSKPHLLNRQVSPVEHQGSSRLSLDPAHPPLFVWLSTLVHGSYTPPGLLSGWLIWDLIPCLLSPLQFPSLHFPLDGGCRNLPGGGGGWGASPANLDLRPSCMDSVRFFLFLNIVIYSQICCSISHILTENSFFIKSLH